MLRKLLQSDRQRESHWARSRFLTQASRYERHGNKKAEPARRLRAMHFLVDGQKSPVQRDLPKPCDQHDNFRRHS